MNKLSARLKQLFATRYNQNNTKQSTNANAGASTGVIKELLVYKAMPVGKLPSWSQFLYITKLLSRVELWICGVSLVIVIVGGVVLGLRWYGRSTEVVAAVGGTYTEGLVGMPAHINPLLSAFSDVDADLTKLIFSGLFRYNDQQELAPDLITNYVESPDALTYTFFLNPNIYWHDGEKLNADDVLFTIAAIQDPLYKSPLQSSLQGVQTQKIDDYSFSLTLTEPFAPFLSTLTFGILPEHLWYDVPSQNVALTELNIRPVGSGPYQFASLTKDRDGNIKSMLLARNGGYYGELANLEELNLIFYADSETALEDFKNKKIEGLSFIPNGAKAEVAKQNSAVRFYSLRLPQYTAVFFNQAKSEVLKSDVVRRALAYAVDRDKIISEVLAGEGEAIYTSILPGYLGHNAEVEKYLLNLDESRRLLEEDGWKVPEQEEEVEGEEEGETEAVTDEAAVSTENTFVPRSKDGVQLEFTIATVDRYEFEQTLRILQENWAAVGVKVNVDYYSPEDIQNAVIKKRDYEALLFGEIVGTDPDPFPFWHSSQQEHPGLALAIFRDREIDQLLEEARKTADNEQRRLKYLHFQNNLAEEVPAIFLYNPLYTYGVHQKVKGIHSQYITVPADRLAGITDWYIATQRRFK